VLVIDNTNTDMAQKIYGKTRNLPATCSGAEFTCDPSELPVDHRILGTQGKAGQDLKPLFVGQTKTYTWAGEGMGIIHS
jgi:hypothetical protein